MNYIQQAYKGLHDWWRYIIGVVVFIMGIFAFSLPHMIAIIVKEIENGNLNNANNNIEQINDTAYLFSLFDSNLNLVFMLLPFAGGLLFLILTVKFLHQQSFVSLTTSRKKIDWKRVFFVFFLWGAISTGLVLLDYFYFAPENYVWNFDFNKFIILAIVAIILVPLQTSCEEYMFRGYLMQGIGTMANNKWVPLLVTSVIFGLLHIANPEVKQLGYVIMVYYIGTGLFLGIMTLMDEGLELALGFHAANNLFTALLVTADWTAFQTYSVLKDTSTPESASFMDIFMPVSIIFPLLLFILGKVYKWHNWKEKLFGTVEAPRKDDYKIIE